MPNRRSPPPKNRLENQAQLSVLDEPNLPNPFQVITDSDIEETNNTNMVDPDDDEDIDIEL